jgi:TM2 domain-containing membrane protein YozV
MSKAIWLLIVLDLLVLSYCSQTCSTQNCNPFGGYCKENKCICKTCYTSAYSEMDCNYKQKSSLISGIIELFFPFGFGHFYLGNTFTGLFKMCLSLFLICGIYILLGYLFITTNYANYSLIREEGFQINMTFISRIIDSVRSALELKTYIQLSHLSFLLIQVIDLILLFRGAYSDGNYFPVC